MKAKISTFIASLFLICGCSLFVGKDDKITSGSNPKIGQYVDVNGVKLYYEVYGEGEPLILLHGGIGSINGFQPNIQVYKKFFNVYAFDRSGHGRSHDSGKPFDYKAMANETIHFMNAVGIQAAYMVGYSDGGIIGYHIASLFPDRVKKLVAVGANVGAENIGIPIEQFKAWLNPDSPAKWVQEIEPEYSNLSPAPNFKHYIERTRDLWIGDSYPTIAQIKKITLPVMIVSGDREDLPLEHAVELYRSLKKGQLCIIPNGDHFILSKRAALMNKIVIEFLR